MGAIGFTLEVARKNTERFINLDPTEIILTPRTPTFVNGTKVMSGGLARAPQIFKLIWTDFGAGFRPTIVGPETARFDFVLVGTYNAIMQIGDYWNVGTQQNEISYIYPFNGYEMKAGGVSHGSKPSG